MKREFKILIFILCFIFFTTYLYAKDEAGMQIYYNAETRASFADGEHTPFWLVSNINGLGSPEFNNGYVKGEIYKPMNSHKKFDWGAGIDLAGAWNLPAAFSIRQLFGEIHYRAIKVSIGSQNYKESYNNPRLSTGDLLFSENAMSIPQLRVGTNGFSSMWGTKGWFSIRAYLSYGMFTDSKWMKNWVNPEFPYTADVLFCGRGLWLRGGNFEKFPLTFDVGIEMGTQFGGKIHRDGETIKMPSKFVDWLKAIIPLAGSDDTPQSEQTNVQGNMNGEYSMSTIYSPTPAWTIRAYWEHYFEDHSQMTFEYGWWKDGLWGLEVSFPKNPFVSSFVYEYVATKDQTGAVNHDKTPEIPEQVSGGDNYFNHYLYGSWQNWGMSLGTPLAISPLYNFNHRIYIYNTRFLAHHFGLEGNPLPNLNWRILMTFSNNWGTYRYPFPDVYHNFSGLIELNYNNLIFNGLYAKASIAWDKGKLLGNNFGGMISIGFEGSFNFSNRK